jgi:CRP-like cAMP-binding protein
MTHYPLLDVLGEEERRSVLAGARRRRFKAKEVVFHEGDPGDTLHLLASGHVAIRIHTPLGDVATVRMLRPGEFFGELAVVAPGPRNATAVALDAAETLSLDRAQFTELRARHSKVDDVLVAALVSEIRRLATQLVDAMYVPVDKRVWRRVADLAAVFGSDGQPASSVPITQDVLAQLTGCTRSTANRVLRGGEDDGVITMTRGRLEILDAAQVARRGR